MTSSPAQTVLSATLALPLARPPFDWEEEIDGKMRPQPNGYFMWIGLPGGKAHWVQIDTGSTGIVVPKAALTDANGELPTGVICLGPARIGYEPSGDVLSGCYYYVPSVNLGGAQQTVNGIRQMEYAAATGPIILFGVEYAGTADDPTRNVVDPGVGMMGIGFGRPSLGCSIGGVPYAISNPFMSVVTGDGQACYQSYLLTASDANGGAYVTIGMTWEAFQAAGANATLAKLAPGTLDLPVPPPNVCHCTPGANPPSAPPAPPCWQGAPVHFSITYAGETQPRVTANGSMLLDTGVDLMMMSTRYSSAFNWWEGLTGATVAIMAPSATTPTVTYSFELGTAPAAADGKVPALPVVQGSTTPVEAPASFQPVSVGDKTAANFVNTGINVIRSFNYFYDGASGYVGFAPIQA